MTWSDAELAQYEKDGFFIKWGLLSADDLEKMSGAVQDLLHGDEAVDGMHREREKSGAVRQVYGAHKNQKDFSGLVRHPDILGPVQQIIDDDVYIWHSKIDVKDAFEGAVWLWHQDYGYWMWDGVQAKMMSVMVLLDRSTINNGCLMAVAGSHKLGRLEHYTDTVTTSYKQWCVDIPALKEHVREEDIRHLTGEAGDVIFFDCNLLHGSSHNMSPLPRKTFIIAYNNINNKPEQVEDPRPEWVVDRSFEALSL